ncbi:hypothetical protein DAEQUDRAFT_761594 [Daedalea quercina L-15889]|uniref:Uncharacterized protein n=1 Tax=Daedalea quercina L-15889 TaxID=1314783 RepID=A0A165TYW5_9APHY|nr:hypothetical protein DAEQUDRAFT_761594 [Daedalea quercina L-15889]
MRGPPFLLVLVVLLSAMLMAAALPVPMGGVRKKSLKQFQMKRGLPGSRANRVRARALPSPSPRPSPSPSRRYVAPATRLEAPPPANTDLLGAW